MPVRVVFFSYLNFTLITVDNIYHSQNVSSNHNETLTVTCSHSGETVEFRYGFKLSWLYLAFRFQTLMPLASRFQIFSYLYRVNAPPKRMNFVSFLTRPASGLKQSQLMLCI